MALRTGNPTLKDSTFAEYRGGISVSSGKQQTMTVEGTVHRTFFLLCLVAASASLVWGLSDRHLLGPIMGFSSLAALVLCCITCFKKEWSPYTASAYAVAEGFALGSFSYIIELAYPGSVIQAVGLTFGTLFCMLAAYRFGLIKATEKFKLGVVAATGGILLLYLVNFGLRLFTNFSVPFVHDSGLGGILFSLFVVGIAALNLVLDFDFIEQGETYGAPKYMEWYGAFGLLVTLVWLYFEILRLMAMLRGRD